MGMATHLGPLGLGTVKNTTGSTAGSVRNIGMALCSQSRDVLFTETTANTFAMMLPAGAMVVRATYRTQVAIVGTSPTFTLLVNGTAVTAALAISTGTAPNAVFTFTASAAVGALLANVGTVDVPVGFTLGGTWASGGPFTISVEYLVRNPDGTSIGVA